MNGGYPSTGWEGEGGRVEVGAAENTAIFPIFNGDRFIDTIHFQVYFL